MVISVGVCLVGSEGTGFKPVFLLLYSRPRKIVGSHLVTDVCAVLQIAGLQVSCGRRYANQRNAGMDLRYWKSFDQGRLQPVRDPEAQTSVKSLVYDIVCSTWVVTPNPAVSLLDRDYFGQRESNWPGICLP